MECRHCGSFISTMFANTCGPGTPCAERQWTRLVHRKQAEIDRLRAENDKMRFAIEDAINSIELSDQSWIAGSLILLRAALKPNAQDQRRV